MDRFSMKNIPENGYVQLKIAYKRQSEENERLHNQIREMQKALDSAGSENKADNAEITALKEKQKTNSTDLTQYKNELKLANKETSVNKQKLQLAKENNKNLNEKNEILNKEIKQLAKTVQEQGDQNKKLQEENRALTMHQVALRKTISDAKKGIITKTVMVNEESTGKENTNESTERTINEIESSERIK